MEMKELHETIKKLLPGEVGDVLRKELDKADLYGAAIKDLTRMREKRDAIQKELDETRTEAARLQAHNSQLKAADVSVKAQLRAIEVTTANIRTEEANKRADVAERLVSAVFRNPTLVRHKTGSIPVIEKWHNPNGGEEVSHTTETADVTETETQE